MAELAWFHSGQSVALTLEFSGAPWSHPMVPADAGAESAVAAIAAAVSANKIFMVVVLA
jgi:hypothetical protein